PGGEEADCPRGDPETCPEFPRLRKGDRVVPEPRGLILQPACRGQPGAEGQRVPAPDVLPGVLGYPNRLLGRGVRRGPVTQPEGRVRRDDQRAAQDAESSRVAGALGERQALGERLLELPWRDARPDGEVQP